LKYDEERLKLDRVKSMPHFKMDETESQIFERLKKLERDEDLISDREGLPFSYIINFMMQLRESMILNERNFVYHAENLLNQHFKESEMKKENTRKSSLYKRISLLAKAF
jgi:hypothetical protein